MIVAVPKENNAFEKRVALSPDVVQSLIKSGFELIVEKDAGKNSFFDNAAYKKQVQKLSKTKMIFTVLPI